MAIINVYKPIGWTPLQCIKHLQQFFDEYKNSPMTYAGRLDPMAEGILLLLSDEDRHHKQEYLGLEKTYQATMLLGPETDTGDMLGIPKALSPSPSEIHTKQIETLLLGAHTRQLPAYSSYKVKGKPLHWWAQQDRLNEIKIPTRTMQVQNVSTISIQSISGKELLTNTIEQIRNVEGNFRQDAIIDAWKNTLIKEQLYTTVSCTVTVTAGTYIRSLAIMLGKALGTHGTLLHLKRTMVGNHRVSDAIELVQ